MADTGYRALLIGNSTFPSDPHNLQDLEGPRNDVHLLRSALTDRSFGLFAPDAVRLVPERSMQEILVELDKFFDRASRDTCLLLYYSGHGLLDETNQLYLCARDTIKDRCRSTGVGSQAINSMIEASSARATTIILDCCHSGAFKGGDLGCALRGAGRFQLTSCRSGVLANDADQLNHASVFTHHLVEGLTGAAPDQNHDGYVSLGELYLYVHERLQAEGKQIPQRHFAGGGDMAIARRVGAGHSERAGLLVSETSIYLDDVELGEELPPERVYVHSDRPVEWLVSTTASWITLERHAGYFDISLQPRLGTNRASVIVHDPATGQTRRVQVQARVVPPASAPEPAASTSPAVSTPPAATGDQPGEPAQVYDTAARASGWSCTLTAMTPRSRRLDLWCGDAAHVVEYETAMWTRSVFRLDGKVLGRSLDDWQTFDFELTAGVSGPAPARLQVGRSALTGRIERFYLRVAGDRLYSEGYQDILSPSEAVAGQLGLSVPATTVLQTLTAFDRPNLFVHPRIPTNKLANARRVTGVPDTEPVLGLIDLTMFGSAKDCFMFGVDALYYRHQFSEPARISYADLATRTIRVVQDTFMSREIDLGDGQVRSAYGTALSATPIVEILEAVATALAQRQA